MKHDALAFWIYFGSAVGVLFLVVLGILIYINSRDNL